MHFPNYYITNRLWDVTNQTCHYVYVPIIISRIQMDYWMITDTSSNISVKFPEKYKNVFIKNGNKMFKIYYNVYVL